MCERKRYDFERLQNFCNENNVVLLEDYTNVKLTQKSRIIGICLTENCGKILINHLKIYSSEIYIVKIVLI